MDGAVWKNNHSTQGTGMKRSIQEQIDILRNSIEWGLQNHPEMPIICREAADTMEAMLKYQELLEEIVIVAGRGKLIAALKEQT